MSRDTGGPHQGEPKPGIQPPAPMVFNGITTALWGLRLPKLQRRFSRAPGKLIAMRRR